jgi:hypothetical protein
VSARQLAPHHRELLERKSAICPDVIAERGWFSAMTWHDLGGTGIPGSQKYVDHFPALVVPHYDPTGALTYHSVRYDVPPLSTEGKPMKYISPKRVGLRLDVPPRCLDGLRDPSVPLWWTEGARKADALATQGLTVVNTPGVDGWRSPSAIPDLFGIPLKDREVICCYDSDVTTKPAVHNAVVALARWMEQRGARVRVVDWTQL